MSCDFVNHIPVLGYAKVCAHYCLGETEEGHKAFYDTTRSTAVTGGGVIGALLGGPAGAAYGGVCGGYLTDSGASLITKKSQGIIRRCEKVGKDIEYGRNPTKSIVATTVFVGFDAAGGYAAGTAGSRGLQRTIRR